MTNKKSAFEKNQQTDVATLGGGCFWCIEAVFDEIKGVLNTESGYAGGNMDSPNYEQVCTGNTGHAEVVQVTFNPEITTFKEILEIFFTAHDPTTLNRQGADIGTQYRSIIFFHNTKQKLTAEKLIDELNSKKIWNNPILTQVEPLKKFYKAEKYHEKYFVKHPNSGYCQAVISPKISKLRKKHWEKLKKH
jgi:peptide-methionine (S)-S-oxide reductase